MRPEFAYVAENLLLRGGYRKTHFQADQTTLQQVSELGVPASGSFEPLELRSHTFTPKVAVGKTPPNPPYVFPLRELIIQSLLRKHLSISEHLQALLDNSAIGGLAAETFEVLGEKAFPEGHIDLLIKEAAPRGLSRKVVLEVKLNAGTSADIDQLQAYRQQLGEECMGAILVARKFGKQILKKASEGGVNCASYGFEQLTEEVVPIVGLQSAFKLTSIA